MRRHLIKYKKIFITTLGILVPLLYLYVGVAAGGPSSKITSSSDPDRCFFNGMPQELISSILSFSDVFDLFQCGRVSTCFRKLTWKEELRAFKEVCEELEAIWSLAQTDAPTKEFAEEPNTGEAVVRQVFDQHANAKKKFFSNHCRLIRLWPYYLELLSRLEQKPQDETLIFEKEDLREAFQKHYKLLINFWPGPDASLRSPNVKENHVFDEKLALDTLCFCFVRERIGIFGSWPISLKRTYLILVKEYGLPREIILYLLIRYHESASLFDQEDGFMSLVAALPAFQDFTKIFKIASEVKDETIRRSVYVAMLNHPKFPPEYHRGILQDVSNFIQQSNKSVVLCRLVQVCRPEDFPVVWEVISNLQKRHERCFIYYEMLKNRELPSEYHSKILKDAGTFSYKEDESDSLTLWENSESRIFFNRFGQYDDKKKNSYNLLRSLAKRCCTEDFPILWDITSRIKSTKGRCYVYLGMLKNPLFPPEYYSKILEDTSVLSDHKYYLLSGLARVCIAKDFPELVVRIGDLESFRERCEVYKVAVSNPQLPAECYSSILKEMDGFTNRSAVDSLLEIACTCSAEGCSLFLKALSEVGDESGRGCAYRGMAENPLCPIVCFQEILHEVSKLTNRSGSMNILLSCARKCRSEMFPTFWEVISGVENEFDRCVVYGEMLRNNPQCPTEYYPKVLEEVRSFTGENKSYVIWDLIERCTIEDFPCLWNIVSGIEDETKRYGLYKQILRRPILFSECYQVILKEVEDFIGDELPRCGDTCQIWCERFSLIECLAETCSPENFSALWNMRSSIKDQVGYYILCLGMLKNPNLSSEYFRKIVEDTKEFMGDLPERSTNHDLFDHKLKLIRSLGAVCQLEDFDFLWEVTQKFKYQNEWYEFFSGTLENPNLPSKYHRFILDIVKRFKATSSYEKILIQLIKVCDLEYLKDIRKLANTLTGSSYFGSNQLQVLAAIDDREFEWLRNLDARDNEISLNSNMSPRITRQPSSDESGAEDRAAKEEN